MSTDTKSKKIPSKGWLQAQKRLGIVVAVIALIGSAAFFVKVLDGDRLTLDALWLVLLVAVYFVSAKHAAKMPRLRVELYEVVVEGDVVQILNPVKYSNSTYLLSVNVRGQNRAGQTLIQQVAISPYEWKTVELGDAYPFRKAN